MSVRFRSRAAGQLLKDQFLFGVSKLCHLYYLLMTLGPGPIIYFWNDLQSWIYVGEKGRKERRGSISCGRWNTGSSKTYLHTRFRTCEDVTLRGKGRLYKYCCKYRPRDGEISLNYQDRSDVITEWLKVGNPSQLWSKGDRTMEEGAEICHCWLWRRRKGTISQRMWATLEDGRDRKQILS